MKKSWYRTWFNSKYYHILYHKRNEEEAGEFLNNLLRRLPFRPDSRIIDIGCGKGRHAIYLHELGYDVQGIDLSEENIRCALEFEKERLSFDVHDMRQVFRPGHYDYVLNLFTSFGYFKDDRDDFQSLRSMADNLKQGGTLVLDYLNTLKVEEEMEESCRHEMIKEGIHFKIEKRLNGRFIEKNIDIIDVNRKYGFIERVKILKPDDFDTYFRKVGLTTKNLFGDYQLNDFNPKISDRMIFIARKK